MWRILICNPRNYIRLAFINIIKLTKQLFMEGILMVMKLVSSSIFYKTLVFTGSVQFRKKIFMVSCNFYSFMKLVLFIINKYSKAMLFQNYENLLVICTVNSQALMISLIFTKWFLVLDWHSSHKRKNNYPAHSGNIKLISFN